MGQTFCMEVPEYLILVCHSRSAPKETLGLSKKLAAYPAALTLRVRPNTNQPSLRMCVCIFCNFAAYYNL